jgi:hypothetical protein
MFMAIQVGKGLFPGKSENKFHLVISYFLPEPLLEKDLNIFFVIYN